MHLTSRGDLGCAIFKDLKEGEKGQSAEVPPRRALEARLSWESFSWERKGQMAHSRCYHQLGHQEPRPYGLTCPALLPSLSWNTGGL